MNQPNALRQRTPRDSTPRRVVLIGGPGVGKGTQGQVIASHLAIPHISTGEIFRHNVEQGTALGQRAKSYMDSGELVPDEVTQEMVRARLSENDASHGFLLDGFPRNLGQAQYLTDMLELCLDEEEIVHRLSGRRCCRSCARTWHVVFHQPRVAGICDDCGGSLYQRDDDREAAIRRRLELYVQQTYPVVSFFRFRGLATQVSATGTVPQVTTRALTALSA